MLIDYLTPEAAAFAAAVLVVLLGLVILAIIAAAVMLIAHAWWELSGKENKYDNDFNYDD